LCDDKCVGRLWFFTFLGLATQLAPPHSGRKHSGATGRTVTVTGYKIFQGLTCLKHPSTLKNPCMEADLICKLC
jgi:hypothetical protein